ncbi:PAS domain-containing sensor histidine kinase [Aquincola sp. J276]|uniref:sensor histidine kinase n=1 Tax=Aquincola sp. J276 TaxID=2898432 RepID=UPI0021513C70|nr:PAS domain-containing sensor histidine kinase [Aquincola sp. J276]MCR5864068.1 PAS domain-containing sensor histidine kinase [Aquincola sp. J276]
MTELSIDNSARAVFDRTAWEQTSLGPPETWPTALRTAVSIILESRLPMCVAWGSDWIQIYNDGYANILGLKHPAAMGASARMTWEQIWATVGPMWARVMTGEAGGFDGLLLTVDRYGYAEECVFNFSYSPLRCDDGQVRGVVVSCVETTDRERFEQRLQWKAQRMRELGAQAEAREQQLQAVLDSVPAAVITVDSRFRITLFNKAAELLFRVSAAQVLGRSVDDLLPQRYRPGHAEKMARFASASGGSQLVGVERELVGRRWDGEEFPLKAAISRVGTGSAALLTVILRDVSEAHELRRERLARAAAEKANQAKSEFLSHLSHELRTPLNAVIGFAQLLAHPGAAEQPDRVVRYAALIRDAGQHQLGMIEQLLDSSQIEEHRLTLALGPVRLSQAVQSSVCMVQERAHARSVSIRQLVCVGEDELVVYADLLRVRQVLLNLLANAVKYNRRGCEVTLQAWQDGYGFVILAVHDTGWGIASELMHRLFTPFERLHADRSGVEGAGIGLARSRKLARLMGGELRAVSTAGVGSTFEFALPAWPAHQNAQD